MNEANAAEDFPEEVSSFEQDALCFGSAVGLVLHDSGVNVLSYASICLPKKNQVIQEPFVKEFNVTNTF